MPRHQGSGSQQLFFQGLKEINTVGNTGHIGTHEVEILWSNPVMWNFHSECDPYPRTCEMSPEENLQINMSSTLIIAVSLFVSQIYYLLTFLISLDSARQACAVRVFLFLVSNLAKLTSSGSMRMPCQSLWVSKNKVLLNTSPVYPPHST